jgi:hypothetical protein
MFVFNCKIDENELLKYPKDDKRKFKKKSNKQTTKIEDGIEYDEYNGVYCSTCNTQVGLYEHKEEIYHFFNVLVSH